MHPAILLGVIAGALLFGNDDENEDGVTSEIPLASGGDADSSHPVTHTLKRETVREYVARRPRKKAAAAGSADSAEPPKGAEPVATETTQPPVSSGAGPDTGTTETPATVEAE